MLFLYFLVLVLAFLISFFPAVPLEIRNSSGLTVENIGRILNTKLVLISEDQFEEDEFHIDGDFNLNNIDILRKKFKCEIGFSDHSTDNSVAMLAISRGARIIEKHIALDGQKDGLDIEFSISVTC